ncbi:T9SS type A sorting domain-containing protein [Fluviicola chungangensis]|uniref:T9SS type A sorting domain-containing protein n=1 Tax=Fluviicola chungangensis TaxID=2597671 RepID=A0A556MPL6_9FLAO|nr:T9SS type A sorting domain-containing protein [Fluviicola chungangensis]TSJ41870.1 T9SS type A sorting domain-containing protein [Fluviicola chungangensis]
MIQNLTGLILLLILPIFGKAQVYSYDWAFSYKGSILGQDLLTDQEGNSYVTAIFSDTFDGDPGASDIILDGGGVGKSFIQKLNPEGELIWIREFNGDGLININSLTLDTAGNLYGVGIFNGTIDFDPGIGVNNITSTSKGFLVKFDTDGNLYWVKMMNGSGIAYPNALALDNDQNPIILGSFSQTIDFDLGASIYNLSSSGSDDFFIQKVDSGGNLMWVKQIYGLQSEVAWYMASDDQDIYISGVYESTKDFDPGPGIHTLTPVGNQDIFLVKLTLDGDFVWAKSVGGGAREYPTDILIDNMGSILLSGVFAGNNVDFDPGSASYLLSALGTENGFALKINHDGDFEWVKTFGSTEYNYVNNLALTSNNEVCLLGVYTSTVDLDPGPGTNSVNSIDDLGCFVVTLDPGGNYLWSEHVARYGTHICTDTQDNLIVFGSFYGTTDFDPGIGVANLTTTTSPNTPYFNSYLKKLSHGSLGVSSFSKADFSIYPNPASNTLTIKKQAGDHCKITGFGADGKMIFENEFSIPETSINIANLSGGTYTLEITVNDQIVRKKFVKL